MMLADGGEAIADLAVLLDQGEVFGPVASTPTAWRLLADTDGVVLASLRAARAQPGKSPGCRPPRPARAYPPSRPAGPSWSWTSTPR
ncbi:hypothetical protein [Streptomyces sp. NPDC058620]|uniref:hypothetical protein n=1 Tax=Streptomyces sp. NPDC058620 TaxID=3346560 RepID=UPI0036573199